MEDYSSNEKVKPEKQIRNIMYMLFGQYVLGYLSSYILFIKICYFIVIPGNSYMTDTCPLRKLYHLN